MSIFLLYTAASLIIFVSAFHSIGGQKLLIGPLLKESNPILDNPTWRAIILFGWHSTTVLMGLVGLYLGLVASEFVPKSDILLFSIAIVFIGLGAGNAVMAKFKHPGWIMLSAIGILTLIAAIT